MTWKIANTPLKSHFFLGTACYPSPEIMVKAIEASGAEVITVSLRRQMPANEKQSVFWDMIRSTGCHILPNTAGCHSMKEALLTAQMAREVFETNWIKLEVIGDDYNLQPDPFELLKTTQVLIQEGFEVFPYCTDDLVLCQRLRDAGCKILMPWGAPIGSGQGLLNPHALRTLRERLPEIHLIVDAGIGAPSDAVKAMQMGFDGVLLNSAVAHAEEPILMAEAFKLAIQSGRLAYEAGLIPQQNMAIPSTPVLGTPFWHQAKETY